MPKDASETSAPNYDFEICPDKEYHMLKNANVYKDLTKLPIEHSLISEK